MNSRENEVRLLGCYYNSVPWKLKKLNSPQINDPMKKWANELNRAFSKDKVQMAKKTHEKCSPSLAIKEMQIKTTIRFHLTPVRMATIKNTNNNNC
jgi:hypothetical protein